MYQYEVPNATTWMPTQVASAHRFPTRQMTVTTMPTTRDTTSARNTHAQPG